MFRTRRPTNFKFGRWTEPRFAKVTLFILLLRAAFSDKQKYSITRGIARPFCDSWASCHLIPERNGQTDRQTDGQSDLLYQYRASVCWRAIKTLRATLEQTLISCGWNISFFLFYCCCATIIMVNKDLQYFLRQPGKGGKVLDLKGERALSPYFRHTICGSVEQIWEPTVPLGPWWSPLPVVSGVCQ